MLKLGSVHDYPEVFAAQKVDAILTDAEVETLRHVSGFRPRREWLLQRTVLKDLAISWLGARHQRYFPMNTLEITPLRGPLVEMRALMMPTEEPLLVGACAVSGDVAGAILVPPTSNLRLGVHVRRVERAYPFLVDHRFTAEEEAWLRMHSEDDLDALTTLLIEVKTLSAELLPEVRDPCAFVIRRVDGEERVHLDWNRMAPPGAWNDGLVQSWHWDDYVIVAALFFPRRKRGEGFEPERLLEWA